MMAIIFNRTWAMPSKNSFDIKCVSRLIHKYHKPSMISIDPFANKNKIAKITNDINPDFKTNYCMDAIEFLKLFDNNSIDFVLYDPPYSSRQVAEHYKSCRQSVNNETTQSSFWGNIKKKIGGIVRPGGIVVSCGWNSGGIGKVNGFEIVEILLVAHGGAHNDTICVVDRKLTTLFD